MRILPFTINNADRQTGLRGQCTVAAAAAGAISSHDCPGLAIRRETINIVGRTIRDVQPAQIVNRQIAELGEADRE